ncbi:hypothetical protein [Paracoccus alcaliphilus]|uniref:hypothetical protein n=2 Tax=Paracoccus alcaliphilus TaxID=34002 RepID=UPI001113D8A1|nr:hypothetical protein [Paracoccus alcaliphilus]
MTAAAACREMQAAKEPGASGIRCTDKRRAKRPVTVITEESVMNSIIYIVGLVVIVLFILSFLGLR